MSEQEKILIEILVGPQGEIRSCEGCSGGGCCGTADYSSTTKMVAEVLQEHFGELVEVRYIDVEQTGLTDYPKVPNVLSVGYRYPITLINGKPRLAGGVSLDQIRNLVEEAIKGPQD